MHFDSQEQRWQQWAQPYTGRPEEDFIGKACKPRGVKVDLKILYITLNKSQKNEQKKQAKITSFVPFFNIKTLFFFKKRKVGHSERQT